MDINNRSIVLFLLCFLAFVCSAQKKAGKMDVKNQVLNTVLNLQPEEYFSIDEQKKMEIGLYKLDPYTFDGIIINTPHELDIRKKGELPVVLAISYDAIRGWEVNFTRNILFVATNILTGEIFIGHGIKDKKRINFQASDDDGPKPVGDALTSRSRGIEVYDLRDLLGIPWKPATYAITCLCWDWVSNTVNVSLLGDDDVAHSEHGSGIISPPISQRNGRAKEESTLPIYFKIDKSPELKNANLAFELGGEISIKSQGFPIYGAFKLPVSRDQIVLENNAKDAAPVVACIPCMFILVKKNQDQSLPWHSNWSLPVYSIKKVVPGDVVEGYFAIDIVRDSGPLPQPNTYCAYVIMGNHIAGPRKVIVNAQ